MDRRARIAVISGIAGVGLTMTGILLPRPVLGVFGIVLMMGAWAAAVWWHTAADDAEVQRQDEAWRRWWC